MLNLSPSEPLALVQALPCFDNQIKLDPLLESSLNLCIYYLISVLFMDKSVSADTN
jgi:hypothetical protein